MAEASPVTTTSSFKFPPLKTEEFPAYDEASGRRVSASSPGNISRERSPEARSSDRWELRRSASMNRWANGHVNGSPVTTRHGHGRQKSLTEAIRTIRDGRSGSVSAGAHEIADALKAPISYKLIGLCGFWYMTSIMSNTSSKTILTALPRPVTLTIIQFAFVCGWSLFLGWVARMYPGLKSRYPILKNGIRPPSRDIIITTLPLTFFQIGGHILSSDATSRIPVSLVHTIKGLSPLFTVLAYRFFLDTRYSWPTYFSLVPLLLGVTMACSVDFSGNLIGILAALASALLFVTQNIVSKKLFNEAAIAEQEGAARTRKPDKLNLLCYSSGLSFLFTAPIWLFSEGFGLINDFLSDGTFDLSTTAPIDHGRLILEYIFNGTFHFGQSLVAFILLSMISPVTYSVASLIKRVFVILFAIVWFGNKMTSIQGFGIALTFVGLYLYDRVSDADKADKKAQRLQTKGRDSILPLAGQHASDSPVLYTPVEPQAAEAFEMNAMPNGHARGDAQWLPVGTKQEDTWTRQDNISKSSLLQAT